MSLSHFYKQQQHYHWSSKIVYVGERRRKRAGEALPFGFCHFAQLVCCYREQQRNYVKWQEQNFVFSNTLGTNKVTFWKFYLMQYAKKNRTEDQDFKLERSNVVAFFDNWYILLCIPGQHGISIMSLRHSCDLSATNIPSILTQN